MPNDPHPRPERVETDTSLRAERHKTDEQLAKRRSASETVADEVVELARERADAVLDASREAADAQAPSAVPPDDLQVARASEDEALLVERAAADERLEAERAERKAAVARLLMLERHETDDRLLTERDRADRSVASRDEFLAIVSHDVRSLLAGMALSTEVLIHLQPPGVEGDQARREAHRIRRHTVRMNGLVGDLIDVVSMESGKLRVEPTEQDATRLLVEVAESFQLLASAKQIRLVVEAPTGPVLARFDHDRLLQVMANLIGNALKFTAAGGCITLGLACIERGALFTVRDDGCGIASDQLDSVFERFSQASQSDRRGLGLGLYIARCIIEAHGGRIWVESTPGAGSVFHFTLDDETA